MILSGSGERIGSFRFLFETFGIEYPSHAKTAPKTTNQLIFKIRVRFKLPQGNGTKSERNESLFMNTP